MKESIVNLGLDVHSTGIVAVAVDEDGTERNLGMFGNGLSSLRKIVKKAGKKENIRAVYEAGPTGYGLYWDLESILSRWGLAVPLRRRV